MYFFRSVLVVLFSASFGTSQLMAQAIVGNTLDPRVKTFKIAKVEAPYRLGRLAIAPELIARDSLAPELVRNYLKDSQVLSLLQSDIRLSAHVYKVNEDHYACAVTNLPDQESLDDIVFYLDTCERYLEDHGLDYAAETLVHESTHHLLRSAELKARLGIAFTGTPEEQFAAEEDFCHEVEKLFSRSWRLLMRQNRPHWDQIPRDNNAPEARAAHSSVWTGLTGLESSERRLIIWGGCRERQAALADCGTYFDDGALYNLDAGAWEPMTEGGVSPAARAFHGTVWTGVSDTPELSHKMIIFGGCAGDEACADLHNDLFKYDPGTRQWSARSRAPLSGRKNPGVAWTDYHFLTWGGEEANPSNEGPATLPVADGAAYDVNRGTWQMIPHGPLSARSGHSMIWTGSTGNPETENRLFIWGGCGRWSIWGCADLKEDGAFLDPKGIEDASLTAWTPLPESGRLLSPRTKQQTVYIPEWNAIVIHGGRNDEGALYDGAVFNLKTGQWEELALAPFATYRHQLVYGGGRLFSVGGEYGVDQFQTKLGTLVLDRNLLGYGDWLTEDQPPFPLGRTKHTAVWARDRLIVWGGQVGNRRFSDRGAIFTPGWQE